MWNKIYGLPCSRLAYMYSFVLSFFAGKNYTRYWTITMATEAVKIRVCVHGIALPPGFGYMQSSCFQEHMRTLACTIQLCAETFKSNDFCSQRVRREIEHWANRLSQMQLTQIQNARETFAHLKMSHSKLNNVIRFNLMPSHTQCEWMR